MSTRIACADGEPMGIAGIWSSWKAPSGDIIHSNTMLTINASGHALMNKFHKQTDEKRMVVILPKGAYQDWLEAPVARAVECMRTLPADALAAVAVPSALL